MIRGPSTSIPDINFNPSELLPSYITMPVSTVSLRVWIPPGNINCFNESCTPLLRRDLLLSFPFTLTFFSQNISNRICHQFHRLSAWRAPYSRSHWRSTILHIDYHCFRRFKTFTVDFYFCKFANNKLLATHLHIVFTSIRAGYSRWCIGYVCGN